MSKPEVKTIKNCACTDGQVRPGGTHEHKPCDCPETNIHGAKGHIKYTMDGHWPMADDQPVVICDVCDGYVEKSYATKPAMNHQPLPDAAERYDKHHDEPSCPTCQAIEARQSAPAMSGEQIVAALKEYERRTGRPISLR